MPSLFGSNAVYATVDAVETFVDDHYREQIARLRREDIFPELRKLLEHCRAEEIVHRDEARQAGSGQRNLLLQFWCRLIGSGSAAAVGLARWR